ncbi:hypothetical protein QQ045_010479 [Rhodiola kirilowii]
MGSRAWSQEVQQTSEVARPHGEPIQRLGTYMVEGLTARKEASGNKIYHTLKCREPESEELLNYMHILYDIAQGTQWITLLHALAARPAGGPPHVHITGIDDPLPVFAPDITMEMLDVRCGEALAVNFPLQLHHTPDESVDVNNPRDGLLRMIKSLNPRVVVTLIKQESNTNTTPFFNRFLETLDYYSAVFESIDVTMARDSIDRINVEMHCLARDTVNIIACESKRERERVERHELLGKWKSRFTMAGFQIPAVPTKHIRELGHRKSAQVLLRTLLIIPFSI